MDTAKVVPFEKSDLDQTKDRVRQITHKSHSWLKGKPSDIVIDYSRDDYLTDFGKMTLADSYLLPGEGPQDLFARVATYYADNVEHAQRLYDYISRLWFMPATPILSNGGTNRGLPISCFLSNVQDSLDSIIGSWNENAWLAAKGGGTGVYWGNVREVGHSIGRVGESSGIVPFIRVQESITLAISQGSLRRGNSAIYLPVWHPEIEEFIEIRRTTGGDPFRKTPHINNAVVIDDKFMHAVEKGSQYELLSPADNSVVRTIDARSLFSRILTTRIETGEPYILFIDNVKRKTASHHAKLGLHCQTSNLCSEIVLPTGIDHLNNHRTAVCCLSSLNLDKFLEWQEHPFFILDVYRMLDNVLEDFIQKAPDSMHRAVYSAKRERSVGLGVMGFHSFLQSQNVPLEAVTAKSWNWKIFKYIHDQSIKASETLADERGSCPDAIDAGEKRRFSYRMAIAPTASISIICGGTSAGIEPRMANAYVHKTKTANFGVRNPYLQKVLKKYDKDDNETWRSITLNEGSVQHLDFLNDFEKDVFKTAYELDQNFIIELAADRTPFIDQAQSLNIFLHPTINKQILFKVHYNAWKKGVKSLYYCRSQSIKRAEQASQRIALDERMLHDTECLSCQ